VIEISWFDLWFVFLLSYQGRKKVVICNFSFYTLMPQCPQLYTKPLESHCGEGSLWFAESIPQRGWQQEHFALLQ